MSDRLKFSSFFSKYWILILVVAAKFILQYTLVNPVYELHRDEFLHLDQANHLSFGYISVPPFTSLISHIIFILGGDEFWVRFFPALFGALTIVFAWLIVEELDGGALSKLLVSLALLFSVLLRLNVLFQPNSFDILAWTMIYFFLIKFINRGNNMWLYCLAIITAIGFHNKYTVVFLIFSLVTGLLLTSQRILFRERALWKAVLIAFVLILPNLIWQVASDFPVIDHMRVLKKYQLDNNSFSGFLLGQVRIQAGFLPITVAALAGIFSFRDFIRYRFAGIAFIVAFGLFGVLQAKDYYTLGLYPGMVAIGGVYLEKALSKRWSHVIITTLIVINLVITIMLLKFFMPVLSPEQIINNREIFEKSGMLRWEDGKNHQLPQDFADMVGWKEMADKAYDAYKMIPEDQLDNTLIFCDNYGQTGALNYYNRGRMREAYSFNTDYIYWLPEIKNIRNVILVGEMTEDDILAMFESYKTIGFVENEYAREKGTGIFLFTGAKPEFTEFFYNEAQRRKRELDIF